MSTVIVAIDPGAAGGMAFMDHDGEVDATSAPATPKDACDWLAAVQAGAALHGSHVKCFMEKVGGYIAGAELPGSAMFEFGRTYGQLEGFLIALGIPFEEVTPQRWQKCLALGSKGTVRGDYKGMTDAQKQEERKRISKINSGLKRDWKNKLKTMAQNLNPQLKVTLNTADALLILEYGRRQENVPQAQKQGQLV